MKFSSKVQNAACRLCVNSTPMRCRRGQGRNIYHLNIGQPDIETPKRSSMPSVALTSRCWSTHLLPRPRPHRAIRDYYAALDMHFAAEDILITNGGSEALQIAMNCILDDGDEILIPEPFYPQLQHHGPHLPRVIHPVSTSPEEGYFYADRRRIEAEITPRTRAIW